MSAKMDRLQMSVVPAVRSVAIEGEFHLLYHDLLGLFAPSMKKRSKLGVSQFLRSETLRGSCCGHCVQILGGAAIRLYQLAWLWCSRARIVLRSADPHNSIFDFFRGTALTIAIPWKGLRSGMSSQRGVSEGICLRN